MVELRGMASLILPKPRVDGGGPGSLPELRAAGAYVSTKLVGRRVSASTEPRLGLQRGSVSSYILAASVYEYEESSISLRGGGGARLRYSFRSRRSESL